MQKAEVVLAVLRERGRKGLPLTQLYRQMFNKDLYLLAYGNIYSNQGAMTPGANAETADGMSEGKIDQIIEAMRHEQYRFCPARRVYIPKKNGKLRPLGLPSWSDKLVGEVARLLLEAIYEPRFSDRSHGFRKGRGCHTALREIRETWTGTTWFVEGDISDCYGSFDHEILLGLLAEKIHDQRFLRFIRHMLKAGYLEDWDHHDTLSGVPQGGVVSPILSNIYLHKLDEFVERELIPQYTRGAKRAANPAYRQVDALLRRARRRGDRAQARRLAGRMRTLPSTDPMDPGYRRLRYVRYADDHLLGFTGSKAEAEQIKAKLTQFLRETLGLELNAAKTLISHARTQRARFLGYDIIVQHSSTKITRNRRSVNGRIALRVPPDVVKAQCARYRCHGKLALLLFLWVRFGGAAQGVGPPLPGQGRLWRRCARALRTPLDLRASAAPFGQVLAGRPGPARQGAQRPRTSAGDWPAGEDRGMKGARRPVFSCWNFDNQNRRRGTGCARREYGAGCSGSSTR